MPLNSWQDRNVSISRMDSSQDKTVALYQDANALTNQSFDYGSSMFDASNDRLASHKIFLFGYPIAQSLAPLLHNTLFKSSSVPWNYSLVESKDKNDILPKLSDPMCIGIAVTMPHKVTFMSQVDFVTAEARIIGAINTVFKRRTLNNKTMLIGTNTDCIGIREAFLQSSPDILRQSSGRPALIIGGGGTCRGSIYALWKWLGVSEIYLVNRLASEIVEIMESFQAHPEFTGTLVHVETVEQATSLESPALIVGAVPNCAPKEPGEIAARKIITHFLARECKGVALEMCYAPKIKTEFFELAKGNGWQVIPGTEPMIYQGIAQQALWLELPSSAINVAGAEEVIHQALTKT